MKLNNSNRNIQKGDIVRAMSVLVRMFAHHRVDMVVFLFIGIMSAVGNAAVPYLIGMFVDALGTPSVQYVIFNITLPFYVAILIAWALIQVGLVAINRHEGRYSDAVGLRMWAEYMSTNLAHLVRLPLAFHKQQKMGEVFRKVDMAGDAIERIFSNVIIQLSPQLLSIVVALGITFYIQPTLGVFLTSVMLVYVFIFSRSIAPLASMQKTMHEQNSRVWGDAHDIIANVRQVKEVVAEEDVSKKISTGFQGTVVGTWTTMFRLWGDLYFYQKLIIFFAQVIVFVYAIQAILQGTMTVGELLAVNGYAAMVFGPFIIIGRNWQNIQNGIVNINETEKLLQTEEEVYVPDNAYAPTTVDGRVAFDHVSFSYNENRPILKDISFVVEPGETVAIVGESGVGKTTLIDLLLGFHFATEGRVLVDNHDVRTYDLRSLRKNIAVVSQDIVLFNDTVTENIAFGHTGTEKAKVQEVADMADAKEFIDSFPEQWEQVVGERGIKLSGGQRQRIAIARAILKDPQILILDEPTSALDARTEQRIQQSLEKVMEGKTTFIIAHRFSTVKNADKIIVLKEGSITQIGTHEELVAVDGEYRNLYELQIGLHE